jgi:hypothetical protein
VDIRLTELQIAPDWSCFNHTVKRWFPVANLTTHRQATIYESYSPGANLILMRKNKLIKRNSLTITFICREICEYIVQRYLPHASRHLPSLWILPVPLLSILQSLAQLDTTPTYDCYSIYIVNHFLLYFVFQS